MKTVVNLALPIVVTSMLLSCGKAVPEQAAPVTPPVHAGQSAVQDDESQKNVVQTAARSDDHKTLVVALKAADYVDALSNAGPFTVFAPTDAAFGLLPEGTVESLVKAENKLKLQDILEYHVYVGVIRESMIHGSLTLNQVNGKNVIVTRTGNDIEVNGAKVVATIPASNGIVYVIDRVLLPE
ncbi:MAG TPA: fasciclin domain-containing protein [Chryseosolibacter sp.]|nr:fasciclin domain-containing protein [Chryseosolibacter sp.]